MDVTPRLAVTQEQASVITSPAVHESETTTCVLRLGHRPTMPCSREHLQNGKIWSEAGVTPIPEGTEVCIEWVELVPNDICGADEIRHPVATATLGSVQATTYQTGRTDNTPDHLVTLTNLRPIGADQ